MRGCGPRTVHQHRSTASTRDKARRNTGKLVPERIRAWNQLRWSLTSVSVTLEDSNLPSNDLPEAATDSTQPLGQLTRSGLHVRATALASID
jgi:hypothetical protein